jgi:CBS domain-containing protein
MLIRDAMTPDPIVFHSTAAVTEAARAMKEYNVGDVVVRKDGRLCGIVTDRDIVVRVLADGKNPDSTSLDSVCTPQPVTVSPNQTIAEAVKLMKERAIRRLPVIEDNTIVGIVSLGDLAMRLDRGSALGQISAAPPSH